ncbi:MAG TPA: hypothetical protein VJ697_04570 [Nitrososphaeraceae archaeon]|nr:hypothetical protein [Nitrososphaeraceae archaeon]
MDLVQLKFTAVLGLFILCGRLIGMDSKNINNQSSIQNIRYTFNISVIGISPIVINYSTINLSMKIVLATTILVAVLTIGIVSINNNNSINNAYAQEGFQTKDLVNETINLGNNSGMMGMEDEADSMKMKLNGTINVESTIAQAFKSKITTDLVGAIQAAQASVGANSFPKEAELTHAHGFLIYKVIIVDENLKKYKVIVDPGNGQILIKKDVTLWYDEHEKMIHDGEQKYDKYSSDRGHGYDSYDDENKMMMKEKKY